MVRFWMYFLKLTEFTGGLDVGGREERNDSKVSDMSNGRTEFLLIETEEAVGANMVGQNVKAFRGSWVA